MKFIYLLLVIITNISIANDLDNTDRLEMHHKVLSYMSMTGDDIGSFEDPRLSYAFAMINNTKLTVKSLKTLRSEWKVVADAYVALKSKEEKERLTKLMFPILIYTSDIIPINYLMAVANDGYGIYTDLKQLSDPKNEIKEIKNPPIYTALSVMALMVGVEK